MTLPVHLREEDRQHGADNQISSSAGSPTTGSTGSSHDALSGVKLEALTGASLFVAIAARSISHECEMSQG